MSERVLVGMASIPERVGSLELAVRSLAPQCESMFVALNEYRQVPGFFARHRNVVPVLLDGSGGDAEKFAAVDEWDGYVVTADDDVLYPPDYVARLRAGLERYGRGTAVGFHGGRTEGWNGKPVAATHLKIPCLGALAADFTGANVLGTGAMAYHTDGVPVWRDVFRHPNMADVHMACHLRTMGVRSVVLAHERGWLQDICPPAGRRIYDSNARRDRSVCDTRAHRKRELDRFDWHAPAPKRPTVHVAVATCSRPGKLLELLEDLAREAQWVDLEVSVYEDPSATDYRQARRFADARGWSWHRFPRALGRREHWKLVDRELREAEWSRAGWFLFLPDDVRLVRHAVPRAIITWGLLDEPAALTLWRLRSLEGQANWTGKRPAQREHATEVFHLDGLYLCRRETLELLGFRCPTTSHKRALSSGVGAALSRQLHRAGKRMYRVDRSLAISNDDGISIMNPQERLVNPAVAL